MQKLCRMADSNSYIRNYRCYPFDSFGELILFIVLVKLDIFDMTLTSVGLLKGIWYHYNPLGVWIYNNLNVFGFVGYRLLGLLLIFILIRYMKIKTVRYVVMFIGIWIYLSAIVWDLRSLGYPELYNLIPYWLIYFEHNVLYFVFNLVGII